MNVHQTAAAICEVAKAAVEIDSHREISIESRASLIQVMISEVEINTNIKLGQLYEMFNLEEQKEDVPNSPNVVVRSFIIGGQTPEEGADEPKSGEEDCQCPSCQFRRTLAKYFDKVAEAEREAEQKGADIPKTAEDVAAFMQKASAEVSEAAREVAEYTAEQQRGGDPE
jgi:hypothetical protein